ncbi:uncharacterized protein Fot_10446 [Forsythia ovata]|uniref:Uncharacterized protein n=1 Tax=Forsythia ovata TaxID=205694 RepID=A0ABD1WH97_9LAMI
MSMRSSRRHVLEDIEIKDDKIEEEAGRVSFCIPTKNALLLMWCRYNPMKMAVLANRFSWDANVVSKQEDANEDEVDDEIPQRNVPVSIAEAESEVPQNDLFL